MGDGPLIVHSARAASRPPVHVMVRHLFGAINVLAPGFTLLALQIVHNLIQIVVKFCGEAVASVSYLLGNCISHRCHPGFRAESK